jgi:hypothetical protein
MKKFCLIPILFLFLWSCTAPRVVTKITPEAPEGSFALGREYIPLGSESIDVELGFDGIYGPHLVFDFVVVNSSSEILSIQPKDFYYVLLDSATADSSKLPPHMAVKPEKVLLSYDQIIEDKHGQKKANSFLGFLDAGVGLLATTAAFISTENPVYISDAIFNTVGTANHYIVQDKQIKSELEMIHEEKEVVDEEIFRSCQVAPGEVVSGFVYFPMHSETGYYMFCFPMENQLFQFVYRQQKVLVYD